MLRDGGRIIQRDDSPQPAFWSPSVSRTLGHRHGNPSNTDARTMERTPLTIECQTSRFPRVQGQIDPTGVSAKVGSVIIAGKLGEELAFTGLAIRNTNSGFIGCHQDSVRQCCISVGRGANTAMVPSMALPVTALAPPMAAAPTMKVMIASVVAGSVDRKMAKLTFGRAPEVPDAVSSTRLLFCPWKVCLDAALPAMYGATPRWFAFASPPTVSHRIWTHRLPHLKWSLSVTTVGPKAVSTSCP